MICLGDWPFDDFLKKDFARHTYGIISEFDPIIRDVEDYSKEEWERLIISLGEKVKHKYGVILDW